MTSSSPCEELVKRIQALEKELEFQKSLNASGQLKQKYLEAFLDNTNMPIFLKNTDYTYIFMNRQLGNLARVDHEQVEGKDDFETFSADVAQLFREQDEEVVKRRELVSFEETITLPDGVQTFMTSKFPLFRDGEIIAVGGVCTDITSRKKTEAKLQKSEEKYRSIFDNSTSGILHIDQRGTIISCNEKLAEMIGSSREKIVGFDLLGALHDEKEKAALVSVLSGQSKHYQGNCNFLAGNQKKFLQVIFSKVSSENGSTTAAVGMVEDITIRKAAEDALQIAHDELEQRVAERTAELDRETKRLEDTNIALKVLLDKRDEDKQAFEKEIMINFEKLIYPYLEKLKMICNEDSQKTFLEIIQANIDEITSSFAHNNKEYLSSLTPAQIQVADLIKQGRTTKEIAHLLSLSPLTIARHRQEIRKRLSLANKKINLQAVLTANL